jgi:hypothetical protein
MAAHRRGSGVWEGKGFGETLPSEPSCIPSTEPYRRKRGGGEGRRGGTGNPSLPRASPAAHVVVWRLPSPAC